MSEVTSSQADPAAAPGEATAAGGPPPPPPALSQVEVGERIGALLIQRQLYRRQVHKTLSDSRTAIAALNSHAGASKPSSSVPVDDFARIEKAIRSGHEALAEIAKIDAETERVNAALKKEAENNRKTLRFWLIAGGLVFFFVLLLINSR